MPANPNWARWVFASVATYLKQVAIDADLPAIVEGLDDRPQDFMEATARAEIRINGPDSQEISHGYYQLLVMANVLITCRYDDTKGAYDLDHFLGLYQEAMDQIPLFKLGSGLDDDRLVQLGCLSPGPSRNDRIRVFRFGQIEKTDKVKQALIDVRYFTEISE
mgnify:CR=1 FL=1